MNTSDLITSIGKICSAIDTQTDWFCAYLQEERPRIKRFNFAEYLESCDELRKIAKEESKKYE